MTKGEVSIQEFLDLELPDLELTTKVQEMLRDADVDEEVAEILGTIVYNLEKALLETKLALFKTRLVCEKLTTHSMKLETRLIKAEVPIRPDQEELESLVDAIEDALNVPL